MTPVGFSHSEISGSKPVCDSPELFAANYVLHRHLTPRHSSCALSSLTANLLWIAPRKVGWSSPPSIIATRRLRLQSIAGPQSPHLADPNRERGQRMRFKVEIEARLANLELWNRISNRRSFSFSRHAFASSNVFQFSKNFDVFRSPTLSLLCRSE